MGKPDDQYDLIFVGMKYNDFPAVLLILAKNQSQNIILVGNNGDAR
jgi:2-dehydropantoate 2-reductase